MNTRLKLNRKRSVLSAIVLTAFLFVSAFGLFDSRKDASAVTAGDFKAGNIIDDAVFYDKNAMNVQEIQNFLVKQVPNCDTWGTWQSGYGNLTNAQYAQQVMGWHGPPYVCLTNYHENPTTGETSYEKGGGYFAGGISAAQIIYNAAQQYGISPKVLLVLLKKESAGPLTNDTWPLKSQYRYAMGYACPDSGPSYSANCSSSRAGFYNQMTTAAWQLKYYKEHPNDYRYKLGWNQIQYAPDPACGTKNVNIENLATLSLYIYTPYTPNDAALRNYPGTANCGAYGNRNFFMFYNDWFGSTHSSRWMPLMHPRVMVTNKATYKINPDSGQKTQDLPIGLQIMFPTKTALSDNTGCLRTQSDTNNQINACIKFDDLSNFNPTLENVSIYDESVLKQTIQWTCKVNYQNLQALENQCFNSDINITIAKKTTVAGINYYITKLDSDNKNTYAFRADRLKDTPDPTMLDDAYQVQKNTRWTCKVDIRTKKAIESQCFDIGTEINFVKKTTLDGIDYIVTKHDYGFNNPTAFLANRFTVN